MQTQIDKMVTTDGILAACIVEPDKHLRCAAKNGDQDKWTKIFQGLSSVLDLSDDDDVRVILGNRTITMMRDGTRIIGATTPVGHPIAKSLRRMMRRAVRRHAKPAPSPLMGQQPSP